MAYTMRNMKFHSGKSTEQVNNRLKFWSPYCFYIKNEKIKRYQKFKMPLPAALQARLAKRGLIKTGEPGKIE